MWDKLAAQLALIAAKYVVPYVWKQLQVWLHEQFIAMAAKRAYKRAAKEAQKKYDAIVLKPDVTAMEKANAFKDLINAKPTSTK